MLFGIVIGLVLGAAIGYKLGTKRPSLGHTDYKNRWLSAVKLLGSEGSLTDDQVRQITENDVAGATIPSGSDLKDLPQSTLSEMKSWD